MKYFTLANGIKMPSFGLGTFRVEPGMSAYETVLTALNLGYRHIDTAQAYHNEEDIGNAIVDSKIAREDIFITTKQWNHHNGDENAIMADIEESLKKLKVDYVDLLLIHWPNHDPKINDITWKVLEKVYRANKARAIGVSNFNIHHLNNLAKNATVMPMANQVEMHPGLQQAPLQQFMKEHNMQMISYGPFMKGNIYQEPYKESLELIALELNASIAQVVIAWGISRNIVMIPKSTHESRLKENLDATNLVLTAKQIEQISKLNRGQRVYTDPDNNPF